MNVDEAERYARMVVANQTTHTAQSHGERELLAALTAEIDRLRRALAGSEHTATVLADVIRALRRTLPAAGAMILESVLTDRGIEVGDR